jgi:predicted nucleic acid-binding Zn finger protein
MNNLTIQENGKKVTLNTVKAFARRNFDKLYIRIGREFDGMIDGSVFNDDLSFYPVNVADKFKDDHLLGIEGAWITSNSNWTGVYENEFYKGFEVSNCCVRFFLVIKKSI